MLWLPTVGVQDVPWTEAWICMQRTQSTQNWQWKHPQLEWHSCPRRTRCWRTSQRPCIWQSRQINNTHEGDKWLAPKSRGQRRTTIRDLGSHRTWTSKSLDSTLSATSTCTYWALWRSNMAIHRHIVYHTEAVKSNKLSTAGYSCFQWTEIYQAGRLANGHWDSSRPHRWKQS